MLARPPARALVLLLLSPLACDAASAPAGEDPGTPSAVGGKADGPGDVEVLGWLTPDEAASAELDSAAMRHGWVFWASAGTTLDLEVTQRGSARGLDTMLVVHGPRVGDRWGAELASDDDAGWGTLSRIDALSMPYDGFYLAEVAVDGAAGLPEPKSYRLEIRCGADACTPPGPVSELPTGEHWTRSSAERRATVVQAYRAARERLEAMAAAGELDGGPWAVSLDVDETVLDNSLYQKERVELGASFTPYTWTRWVARREAPVLPGVVAFVDRVRELGGIVALVTNRTDDECPDTRVNLDEEGVGFDLLLCKTGPSEKEARWRMIEEGTADAAVPPARLVLWVGDNIRDFPGLDQDLRFEDETAFGDFGDRFFVLPNPMYGSWSRNAVM